MQRLPLQGANSGTSLAIGAGVARILRLSIPLILAASPLFAATTTAEMHVSVHVIARTIVTVDSQPASVEVTRADLARGYVELPSALSFRVRTNDRNGYVLRFEALAGPFSRASVRWGNAEVVLGTAERYLAQPYRLGGEAAAAAVRLYLDADAVAGTYAWPVRFSAGSF